ncbi:MAG: hypothetical protein KGJ23_11285 [Euryarchaeota archaeon]|nr:hypothetical protein [Euryarchaeota archaeon]MDE1837177.1 hypothetical protein [Euryarchaeota archaeon]MDE1881697.1 hypothetical protein [Euryarchaeota archaeon]MDE2045333.1 hypothetical protein [Thermoplasmata archaeon]
MFQEGRRTRPLTGDERETIGRAAGAVWAIAAVAGVLALAALAVWPVPQACVPHGGRCFAGFWPLVALLLALLAALAAVEGLKRRNQARAVLTDGRIEEVSGTPLTHRAPGAEPYDIAGCRFYFTWATPLPPNLRVLREGREVTLAFVITRRARDFPSGWIVSLNGAPLTRPVWTTILDRSSSAWERT